MRLSVVKEIYGVPWQIEASTLQQFFPLAMGAIAGAEFAEEPEPAINRPYAFSLQSGRSAVYNPDNSQGGDSLVHVLPVRGIMLKHDMVCGPVGTRTLAQRLMAADGDPAVVGHILVFETGGGTSSSVPELADAISGCQKPAIAWVDGMMCSAGQFAGSYCREIIASRPTDLVGSIGTMIVYEGRKSLSGEDSDKVVHLRIYAEEASEKNQEFETAINGLDVTLVKERILNPHNQEFTAQMQRLRPGITSQHLTGRTFRAEEALGALVDHIGGFDFAIERIRILADAGKAEGATQQTSNHDLFPDMKYPKLMSTLDLDDESFVFESDGRRTFTREEMAAVELALNDSPDGAVGNLLAQTNADLADARTELASLQASLDALVAENQLLKSQPAAEPAAAPSQSDPKPGAGALRAISDKYEKPLEALSAVSEEYLGKKL
jgi:protease IV